MKKRLKLFVVTVRGRAHIVAASHSVRARDLAFVFSDSTETMEHFSVDLLGVAKQGTKVGVLLSDAKSI